MKTFVHFVVEIFIVLDSPGGCCEAICKKTNWIICGFGFSRRLLWSHLLFFCLTIYGFGFSRKLLWSHLRIFLFKYLLFWILKEAVVKPFAHVFFLKYLWFWILHEVVVKPFAHFFCLNMYGFGFSRRLLWSNLRICFFKYLLFWILHQVAVKPFAHLLSKY